MKVYLVCESMSGLEGEEIPGPGRTVGVFASQETAGNRCVEAKLKFRFLGTQPEKIPAMWEQWLQKQGTPYWEFDVYIVECEMVAD